MANEQKDQRSEAIAQEPKPKIMRYHVGEGQGFMGIPMADIEEGVWINLSESQQKAVDDSKFYVKTKPRTKVEQGEKEDAAKNAAEEDPKETKSVSSKTPKESPTKTPEETK